MVSIDYANIYERNLLYINYNEIQFDKIKPDYISFLNYNRANQGGILFQLNLGFFTNLFF